MKTLVTLRKYFKPKIEVSLFSFDDGKCCILITHTKREFTAGQSIKSIKSVTGVPWKDFRKWKTSLRSTHVLKGSIFVTMSL